MNNDILDIDVNIWKTLVQSADIGLWNYNKIKNEIMFNNSYANIIGYKFDDIPYDIKFIGRNLNLGELYLNKVKVITEKYKMSKSDGTVVWILEKAVVTERDSAGNAVNITGIVQDITFEFTENEKLKEDVVKATAELEQSKRTNEALFDSSPHANILIDTNFNVIDCNPHALKYFGLYYDDKLARDEAKKKLLPVIYNSIPKFQPGGRKSISLADRFRETMETGQSEFETRLNIGSNEVTFNVIMKYIPYGASNAIAIYISERSEIEERINIMFDAMPLACVLINNNRQIIDCNKAAMRLSGISSKENFAVEYYQNLPPTQPDGRNSLELIREKVQEAYEKGSSSARFNYKLVNFNNEDLPVEVIFVCVKWKDEYVIISYARDLRELTKSEQETQRHAQLLEMANKELIRQDNLLQSINDAAEILTSAAADNFDESALEVMKLICRSVKADRMCVWENTTDEEGKIIAVQRYEWAEDTTPKLSDEAERIISYDLLPYMKLHILENKPINMLTRDFPNVERAVLEAQNVVSVLMLPVHYENKCWGFVGFDDCFTERVYTEIEENILQSAGILIASAIERNNMTNNLIEAKENATASNVAKSEFLSRMSHEIRTPMNAIIGMTAIAKKSDDISKIKECLRKIDDSSRQLLSIINDVLDMSKIESGKFEITSYEFDFERMIQNIINVVQVKMNEKHQNFLLDIDVSYKRKIISDELRLSQVLINLLGNAVKFTPDLGTITLKIVETSLEDDMALLRVEVIDNGIGISEEAQGRLFNSFEQVDGSTSRKFGGTGLGLAICKKIVTMMGGNIWLESELGKGSSFIFEVKIKLGLEHEPYVKKPGIKEDFRILIVDDNFDTHRYYKELLTEFSFKGDVVSSGKGACSLIEKRLQDGERYDIVFLDWSMDDEMSGDKIAAEIQRVTNKSVEIVVISGTDWVHIEEKMSDLGLKHFLPKPVLPSALYNTIMNLVENVNDSDDYNQNGEYDWQGKTMLLVEDIEINREIIISVLADTNIEIESAENGEIACNMFRENSDKYDIILMDIQMPVLDGLMATKRIRAFGTKKSAEIPIIAMTANAFKEDIEICIAAGMNSHIAKPIDADTICADIAKYIK
jgi:Signal transduction histidine kinase